MYEVIKRLVDRLGQQDFMAEVLAFVDQQVSADHLSLFLFNDKLIPRKITGASRDGGALSNHAGKAYLNTLSYRYDPNTQMIMGAGNGKSTEILLRLRASEITDQQYYEQVYSRYSLCDRVSIISSQSGRWYVLNFYRDVSSGEFSDKDMAGFAEFSGLLEALLRQHFMITPPDAWQSPTIPARDALERLVFDIESSLSQREIEVCSMALQGMTNIGIGLDLGIQSSTVATLRKRAFAKLNVCSLNELFALCLGQVIRENA